MKNVGFVFLIMGVMFFVLGWYFDFKMYYMVGIINIISGVYFVLNKDKDEDTVADQATSQTTSQDK